MRASADADVIAQCRRTDVSSLSCLSIKVLSVQEQMWRLSDRSGAVLKQERSKGISCRSPRWANAPFFTRRAEMMSSPLRWPQPK